MAEENKTKTVKRKSFGRETETVIAIEAGLPVTHDADGNLITGISKSVFLDSNADKAVINIAWIKYKIECTRKKYDDKIKEAEELQTDLDALTDELESLENGKPSVASMSRKEAKLRAELEKIEKARKELEAQEAATTTQK